MELGMASELVQTIQHAAEAPVSDGSEKIAQERFDHFNHIYQSVPCAGKARKYGSVSGTLDEIDKTLGISWLHELWNVGSMVSHQGMLDRIMRDIGNGVTLVGEPATLLERAILLERSTSVYGLIGRELLLTNSPEDVLALDQAAGSFQKSTAEELPQAALATDARAKLKFARKRRSGVRSKVRRHRSTPAATTVYSDNSVLDAVSIQDKGGRLKTLMKAHSEVGVGSVQNLIEAFGIRDQSKRAQLIRTILQVSRRREEAPLLFKELNAVIGQLRLHHPNWLVPKPDLRPIAEDRASYKRVWRRLRNDPTYRPAGYLQSKALHYAVIGESKRRAKETRDAKQKGLRRRSPIIEASTQRRLQPQIDRLGGRARGPNGGWRLARFGGNAAHQRDDQMGSLSDWLVCVVRFEPQEFEDWMRFWLSEVDGAAVPLTRIEMLAGLFQVDLKVDAGLSGDVLHAAHAGLCDVILTADRGFHRVLTQLATVLNLTIAKPVFS